MTIPNLREHKKLCEKHFGKALTARYGWINGYMDHFLGAQELLGKDHRRIAHNEEFAQLMESVYGYWAGQFVRYHILCDRASTERKNAKAREKYKKDKENKNK
ncbi:MAG: hypothetical protein IMF19_12340 [Proteobacteria bacterium]|nr:hypothetical protein [Pseudomonadota bacterium]